MGCSSGTAVASVGSGSTMVKNSRLDEELQSLMDQRKRKRMISNRESARRSRKRKQKHLDNLAAHATQLKGENSRLILAMNMATQQYLAVETENSILRVQIDELSQRLRSLDEIIAFSGRNSSSNEDCQGWFVNPKNTGFMKHQQLGIFQY